MSRSACWRARRRPGWPSWAPRARSAGPLPGRVAVVDVGGGSTEIAVGTLDGGVEWAASFPFGSGFLADAYLGCDPPSASQMEDVRAHAARALAGIDPGPIDVAVAVGGSAASLRRLVGEALDADSLAGR